MTTGYALGQLGQALRTAATHEAPDARRRANRRARQWAQAIAGMLDDRVVVGSRAPVRDLPSWVTLDVLRGGFATGSASAEVPLEADELALAHRLGIPAARALIFRYYLTDAGLEELCALLDSGAYRVDLPEDAALLSFAWLARAGDRGAALDVLDALSPFADRLRLMPKAASTPTSLPDHVYRITAGEAAEALRLRRPNPHVEAQREALAVWNPFSDRVLALWLETQESGWAAFDGDPLWRARASDLVDEYDRLAALHTRCSKHRKPQENLAILLRGLRAARAGVEITARERGLIRRAVEASVDKRGAPGSPDHAALRGAQSAVAGAPAHRALAALAAERLAATDPAEGIAHPELLVGEVTPHETARSGIAAGSPMPPIVGRLLARAHAAPVEELLDEGVVPSSEVLAALVPRISATVVASGFPDPALARLAAANYRAFRRRRSLLLVNLQKQVQLGELPWARAVAPHGTASAEEAMAVARRLGALTLDRFPATILPNPLVRELRHLVSAAGHDTPFVEELAADIFRGRFSPAFHRAAQLAARVVGGSLYARYYGIDADQILSLGTAPDPDAPSGSTEGHVTAVDPGFDALCATRAGRPLGHWSIAANGMVIEQAQVLTTHNLAALVSIGVEPTRAWVDLARDAVAGTAALLELAATQRRPLATVKDAAYAWRQAVFFLSMAGPAQAQDLLDDESVAASGPAVMTDLLAGLRRAAVGETRDDAVPFLGWAHRRHWILDALGPKALTYQMEEGER